MDGERVEGSWWKKKKSQAMASVGRRKLLDSALCIRLVGQGCCGAAARCIRVRVEQGDYLCEAGNTWRCPGVWVCYVSPGSSER